MATVKQGFMDTLVIGRGTAGVFDTMALMSAIFNAAVIGVEQVIWEMVVPAQQKIRWGFGTAALPMNQGTCSFVAMDATTSYEEGLLSLCAQNAPRTDLRTIKSMDDANLHAWDAGFVFAASIQHDKNQLIPLPEMGVLVGQNSRLVLRYNGRVLSGTTDNVEFSLPITRYMV